MSPHFGFGCSNKVRIFLPALAPFIATWNAEPKVRRGRKNSTATRIKNRAAKGDKPQCKTERIAKAMPTPAPPYATMSMMVVLASCITSTFMVILRNASLFSFIFSCCAPSALKIFNSFKPCTLSRKESPIRVYLLQYLAKIFLAYLDTITMERGINGTQPIKTTATCQLMPTVTPNKMTGASMA